MQRAGLGHEPSLREVVNAVKRVPYGRPARRDAAGVIEEWRGTCSTKHSLLVALVAARWPEVSLRIVHRLYRVERRVTEQRYGRDVGRTVPAEGLWDVHRYVLLVRGGHEVLLDVTSPGGPDWDGRSDMELACAEGRDFPSGADPDRDKAVLQQVHCDPSVREPFIRALSRHGNPDDGQD